jgi:hypothetical protein
VADVVAERAAATRSGSASTPASAGLASRPQGGIDAARIAIAAIGPAIRDPRRGASVRGRTPQSLLHDIATDIERQCN